MDVVCECREGNLAEAESEWGFTCDNISVRKCVLLIVDVDV
jgi:hypothetical protein